MKENRGLFTTLLLTSILLFNYSLSFGQWSDIALNGRKGHYEIPFTYQNNFIVIDLVFNGVFPLKFIFDTGAEHTILAKKEITDLLDVDYQRTFRIFGADLQTELTAYLASGISLQIEDVTAINRSILVLDEDYFKFQEFTGLNIHGLLGADFFRRFVVQIDYRKERIILIDPKKFSPPRKKYKEIDIAITRNKPYIETITETSPDTSIELRLLIDTGASLSLMLFTSSHPDLNVPENVIRSRIGIGLGGSIEGYLGRVHKFNFGEYQLGEVIANFQDVLPLMDTTLMKNRNGLIGNGILERFDIYIDYIKGRLYLSPNKRYNKKFKYDLSGITFIAGGEYFNEFTVQRVIENSPADLAGVKPGDKILKVNFWSTSLLNFSAIVKKFKKKPGKNINLILLRDGERVKVSFQLKELI